MISVGRKELAAALARAKAVTAGSGAHPSLKLVQVAWPARQDGGGLAISATDLHEAVVVTVEALAGEEAPFRVLVGAERILAQLAADPSGEVELGIEGDGIVVAGLARATFPAEAADDFPGIEGTDGGGGVEVTEGVAAAIRRAARFTGDEPGRPALLNVYLYCSGGQLMVVASNGYALWSEESLGEAKAGEGWWVVIPREAAADLEPCRLVEGKRLLFFVREGEVASVRRPEVDGPKALTGLVARVEEDETEGVVVEPGKLLAVVSVVAARLGKDEEKVTRSFSWVGEEGVTRMTAQAPNGDATAVLEGVELPSYACVKAQLLVAGLECLAKVAAEGEEVTVKRPEGLHLLSFELPDGKATLLSTEAK